MASLWPLPDAPTSTSLALTFDLSVASAANPTELNAIGTVAGDLRLVHPTTATSDSATWYRLDASTDSVNAPYIMASATAGLRWIAIDGTYNQGGYNVSGAIVSTGTITGTQLISNIAIGTAPLVVTSTTVVGNLNVSQLLGQTWAVPGSIGATTPAAGAFTTISATGQITSTLAGGTAPLVVTSTTVVPNLNAGLLNGLTWTAPGAIGGTTPATTFALSGILTSTNTTSATTSLLGAVVIGNGTAATSIGMGAGNINAGGALTVGSTGSFGGAITVAPTAVNANLTLTSAAAVSANVLINAGSGAASTIRFQNSGTSYTQWQGTTTALSLGDIANSWSPMSYTIGAIGAGYVTFAGTLAATSSTAASVKFAGGVAINAGLWISSATMISTSTSFTNGAGSSAGTLTNAPAIGNPTKWIPINDNGTTRYIPAW